MPVTEAATRQMPMSDHGEPSFAHLHEYLGEWAYEEMRFKSALAACRPQITAHLNRFASEPRSSDEIDTSRYEYQVTSNGVALIVMRGTMMKFRSSFGGCSTVATRRMIRKAAADEFVKSIVLVIDSPGGTVSGTKELADDVAKVAKSKPVYVQVEDYCCSAAYWVASQATKIFSNPTGQSACIGTYMVVDDTSQMYLEAGIKTYVIRAGEFKGAGVPGTEITEAQLAHWQECVNDLNDFFIQAVSKGRRVALGKAKEWADGRSHIASKCLAMGIIDGVQGLDATIDMAAKARKPRSAGSTAPADNVIDEETDPDEPGSTGEQGASGEPSSQPQADGATANEPNHEATGSGASRSEPTSEEESTMPTETKPDATVPATGAANASENPATTATQPAATKPATLAELKAACPGASADFLLAQVEANATLAQATSAFIADQQAKIQALTAGQKNGAAKPAAGLAAGIDSNPTAASGSYSGDAKTDYLKAVDDLKAKGMTGIAAVAKVMRDQPELAKAYQDQVNDEAARSRGGRR